MFDPNYMRHRKSKLDKKQMLNWSGIATIRKNNGSIAKLPRVVLGSVLSHIGLRQEAFDLKAVFQITRRGARDDMTT
ncbi:MAG: hypothetical protein ABJD13_12000 [Paracoccaceae bacterium]